MYKVFLVDDEYFSREALKKPFAWESYGCTICGEANNGLDGLERARELKPDIVLADINMPFMNGLEMIERMKEFLPDAIYAIVTSHSEFDYAKRGLELGVEHFIVKPVDDGELSKSIEQMVTTLYERGLEQQEYKSLRFWAEKNTESNKNHFLQMLLFDSGGITRERFLYECKSLSLKLTKGGYCVCALKIESRSKREELHTVLVTEADKLLKAEKLSEYEFYHDGRGALYLIFSGIAPEDWDALKMQALIQKLQLEIMNRASCMASAGVGSYCEGYHEITASREAAEKSAADIGSSDFVSRVLEYIHENYGNADLTVTGIAKALYVNYSYLSAQFAKEVGMTASQYILRFRMTRAADMLRTGDEDMVKIASDVGYTNVKYFYRCFKKEFGMTPYQYTESLLEN